MAYTLQKKIKYDNINGTVSAPVSNKNRGKDMKRLPLIMITRSAVIAALYFCATVFTSAISFGPIQFRVGEALTLLPFIFPEASIGLAVGCALANLTSPFGIIDVVLGASVTFVAGLLSAKSKNIAIACLPPILLNAFLIPLVWILFGMDTVYITSVIYMLISQSVVIIFMGVPIVKTLGALPAIGALERKEKKK